jgi:hypothetical protein
VTPARRVAGRAVTTLEGLASREEWAKRFVDAGASQCGFCTPGIIMRLSALPSLSSSSIESALLAHLCRCTGWRTIVDLSSCASPRDWELAARRATLEGGSPQAVGPAVACGEGGFAEDTAPADALVAVPGPSGWTVASSLASARALAGKVQGRRSTAPLRWPLTVPAGDWALTLRTTWVEPAYLEPDAAWATPAGDVGGPLANGGAFGAKVSSSVVDAARSLAAAHGRPVRVVLSREDVVRMGPKRPPIAAGIRADGTGVVRVVRTPGIAFPGFEVEEVDVVGPPTSATIRGAGWVEAAVLRAAVSGEASITSPAGARASASVADGRISVTVAAGAPLDEVVLRSYCIGAAHMALGWVRSEAVAVDAAGEVHDLTIRSFGILRARDTPEIEVDVADARGEPVNGSDAVFAAVAGAAWLAAGLPERWPCARGASAPGR